MLALIGAENTVMKNLNREKEKNGQINDKHEDADSHLHNSSHTQ